MAKVIFSTLYNFILKCLHLNLSEKIPSVVVILEVDVEISVVTSLYLGVVTSASEVVDTITGLVVLSETTAGLVVVMISVVVLISVVVSMAL